MAKQPKKPSRLDRELAEMGKALHRLGALNGEEYAKIARRDAALARIGRAPRRTSRSD